MWQKPPGVMYPDDIAPSANNRDQLQKLSKVCDDEGYALGIKFSGTKYGIIFFDNIEGDFGYELRMTAHRTVLDVQKLFTKTP